MELKNLTETWGQTKEVLLEGLKGSKRELMGVLLENQKNSILTETASAGSTTAHDIAGIRKALLPMIRRIIPGTIAPEIVGVQALDAPVGLVYTMKWLYEEAVTHDTDTSQFGGYDIASQDEIFGNAKPLRQYYSGNTGAAQDAGASGMGGSLSQEADIDASTATGGGWGSTANSTSISSGTASFNDGSQAVSGTMLGGSGSFLEGSGGRKMSMKVVSQAVEAKTRKLQAGWTVEAMQDLDNQHGISLESEITKTMSAEIVNEIDAEIINDLLALAGTVGTFDLSATSGNYAPTFIGDRFANLGAVINYVANEIGRKTRRGAGNFIVVSPMLVSVLQTATKSVFAPAIEGSFKGPTNTMLVGTLNGTIKVYSYLWNQAVPGSSAPSGSDKILVGYKGGNGETDSGYFYAPYVPLMSSGVVVNPITYQQSVSLMTRYGKAVFTDPTISLGNSPDYYGKINVSNIEFV